MTYAPACRFAIGVCTLSLLAVGCAGGSSSTGTGGASGGNSASGGNGSGGNGSGGNGSGGNGSGGNNASGGNGSGGSSTGGNGSGGNASGGSVGSGGTVSTGGSGGGQPTGGTSGSGGGTGSGGAAGGGATGTGGAKGGAGGGAAGASGKGGAGGCASLPLCETFESSTVGAAPSSALWTVINANGNTDTATIDSIGANGTSKSVMIKGGDRVYIRNSTVISTLGPVVHARFYVRFMTTLPGSHGAFMATHPTPADQYTQTPEFRLGSQDMVLHWNNTQGDVNVPDVSPQGDPMSFMPAANTWYCLELTINTSNGHLNVSVNGNDVPGLTEDGVSTQYVDDSWLATANVTSTYSALADFSLGWASYGAGSMNLWFDEIALSPNPIGCN
jgi:hypothetical protein